jgi:hypothetical protein
MAALKVVVGVQGVGGDLPLLGLIGGKEIGQITLQAVTKALQHIEANILLAHFEAM